jgi:hypothetical protein
MFEGSTRAGVGWRCLVVLLALLPTAQAGAGGARLGVVALEGEPAPGGDARYRTFFGISLNDAGDIGISAGLSGGPAHQAMYVLRRDGSVDAILSSDAPPPELGERYAYLGIPELNDAGDFVFGAAIGDVPDGGAWLLSSDSELSVIAAVGDPIPGLADTTYDENPSQVLLNDAGRILLATRLETPVHGDDTALFLISGDTQEIVARSGDTAPVPGSVLFTVVGTEADFNAAGDVVFFALTDDFAASRGVFVRAGGGLAAVALDGGTAPVAGERTFSFASAPHPQINAAGTIAFSSWLEPYQPDGANEGIFLDDAGTLTPLVLTGDRVPGTAGRRFQEVVRPQLDSRGNVVFLGSSYTEGGRRVQGLYRVWRGWISTVVETGTSVPGTGGAALDRLSFWDLRLNDRGTVLFGATLDDGRRGVFRAHPTPNTARSRATPSACSPRATPGRSCR